MSGQSAKCWAWGFAQIWRRFFLRLLLTYIFQKDKKTITLILGTVFYADFGAQIFAQIFCADFVRRFLRRFFVRDAQIIVQIFAQIFHRFFLRRSGASKIGVPESRKNARKICGKICCVPRACPGKGPLLHFCCLERTACHTTAARHKQLRRACECPSWHLRAQRPAFVCSKIFQK